MSMKASYCLQCSTKFSSSWLNLFCWRKCNKVIWICNKIFLVDFSDWNKFVPLLQFEILTEWLQNDTTTIFLPFEMFAGVVCFHSGLALIFCSWKFSEEMFIKELSFLLRGLHSSQEAVSYSWKLSKRSLQ